VTCDEFLSSILQKRCFYSLLLLWCAFIVLRWFEKKRENTHHGRERERERERENEREERRKNTNTRVVHIYTK